LLPLPKTIGSTICKANACEAQRLEDPSIHPTTPPPLSIQSLRPSTSILELDPNPSLRSYHFDPTTSDESISDPASDLASSSDLGHFDPGTSIDGWMILSLKLASHLLLQMVEPITE
jgi:hypothetical protein